MNVSELPVHDLHALDRVLSAKRSPDRPLLIGATIDPAQYLAQF